MRKVINQVICDECDKLETLEPLNINKHTNLPDKWILLQKGEEQKHYCSMKCLQNNVEDYDPFK